jgi:membrane protease YdiL (CAAX protease family)
LQIAGAKFGVGLFVSAILFGFVHALNTVDYYHGRFDFGWWFGAQSVATGIFFGLLRARLSSVWPAAVVHGLGDTLSRL